MEHQIYLMRVEPSMLPAPGGAARVALPDAVVTELETDGWQVVSHAMSTLGLDGEMLLTLYVQRPRR